MRIAWSRATVSVWLGALIVLNLVLAVAYWEWLNAVVAGGLMAAGAQEWRRSRADTPTKWRGLAAALRLAAMGLAALTLVYVLVNDGDARLFASLLSGGLLSLAAASMIDQWTTVERGSSAAPSTARRDNADRR